MSARQLIADYEIDSRGPVAFQRMLTKAFDKAGTSTIKLATAFDLSPASVGQYTIEIRRPAGYDVSTRVEFIGQMTDTMDRSHTTLNSIRDLWSFAMGDNNTRIGSVLGALASPMVRDVLRSSINNGPWRSQMIADDAAELARHRMATGRLTHVAEDRPTDQVPDDFFDTRELANARFNESANHLAIHLPSVVNQIICRYAEPTYSSGDIEWIWVNERLPRNLYVFVDDTSGHGYWNIDISEAPILSARLAFIRKRQHPLDCEIHRRTHTSIIGDRSTIMAYICGETSALIDQFIITTPASYMSTDEVNIRLRAALREVVGPVIKEMLDLMA